ncbi:MAG: glycosyltransferase family 87 protein [Vicinamibacterales bacterium]
MRLTAAEARRHATLAAAIMWAIAAVIAFGGSGYRSVFGPLKGSDFVHFYTLGHLDARTAPIVLYDPEALHRLQTQLVPESDAEHYLTVYPPHTALLFRPFAGLTYGTAALLWAAVVAAVYAGCIWLAWRPFRTVLHDRRLLLAAAAAFPPFWYLMLHGQTTIVPLLGFSLGWLALEHRRPFWAGFAFGLLLLKPQFALVLGALVLMCREWTMLAGAAVSIGVQVMAIVTWLGTSVLWNYATAVKQLPQLHDLLEPKPEQLHSISAVTNRLPADWELIVWALLSVLVIVKTIRVWRSNAPLSVRTGVLVLASVLVNPHLSVYDATVLAPAVVWFAGWLHGDSGAPPATRSWFATMLYGLYVTLLAPTAALLPVQASVLLLGALFVLMGRTVVASAHAQRTRLIPAIDHRTAIGT